MPINTVRLISVISQFNYKPVEPHIKKHLDVLPSDMQYDYDGRETHDEILSSLDLGCFIGNPDAKTFAISRNSNIYANETNLIFMVLCPKDFFRKVSINIRTSSNE